MDNFFTQFVLSEARSYRLTRHIVFWIVCWLFMGFIYGFMYNTSDLTRDFSISYTESLIYLPQHIFLSYTIIYFALPRFIFKSKYWQGFLVVLGLILATALLSPFINNFIINPVRELRMFPVKQSSLFMSFMAGLRGSLTIAGFATAIKLLKFWYFKKVENERLEKENLRAELQLLRGQLHPHFMFNTLNSIYALALKKSDQTTDAILKLSDLLRYVLKDGNDATIPLSKEVEMINNYINLEKNRFGNRLDIGVHVSGNLTNKTVAPLLFLPFIENSFKYGVNENTEQSWISLDLVVDGDILKFKLINGKPDAGTSNATSYGIGHHNVQKRLEMLYPQAHELRIHEDTETYMVQLMLKLDKMKLPAHDEVTMPAG